MSTTSRSRVNWHIATASAIRLTLLAYDDWLQYQTEYVLPGNRQRIDLLIIKKLVDREIPISIAQFFRQFNVFEIKGRNDTLSTDAYYKAINYTSQLIYASGAKNQYTREDVTLSLVTQSYPKSLLRHLKSLQKTDAWPQISIEKQGDGIYYINGETYATQLIVMSLLSPEDYRFMRCLWDLAKNGDLLTSVANECNTNRNHPVYHAYSNELLYAGRKEKEEFAMFEAVFALYDTSIEEVAAKATKEAREENEQLKKEVARLRALLDQRNIPYQET